MEGQNLSYLAYSFHLKFHSIQQQIRKPGQPVGKEQAAAPGQLKACRFSQTAVEKVEKRFG
jgi:hypothetical protein